MVSSVPDLNHTAHSFTQNIHQLIREEGENDLGNIQKQKRHDLEETLLEVEKFLVQHKKSFVKNSALLTGLTTAYYQAVAKIANDVRCVAELVLIEIDECNNICTDHRIPESHARCVNLVNNLASNVVDQILQETDIDVRTMVMDVMGSN